jgi:hypothetical protein
MKIRDGFVSNSSSSSFCIYGICAEASELNAAGLETDDLWGSIKLDDGSRLEVYEPCRMGTFYVGVSLSWIGGDETMNQFRERVRAMLTKKLGEKFMSEHNPGVHAQGWYDG